MIADCGLRILLPNLQTKSRATNCGSNFNPQSAIRNPQSKMLAKRIIPCLDVDRGRVVKGISFVNLVDAGDPVEQGARYDREGADELVFLDITASSDRREIVADMVRRVADRVFIPFTVGGGIRTVDDIRAILKA